MPGIEGYCVEGTCYSGLPQTFLPPVTHIVVDVDNGKKSDEPQTIPLPLDSVDPVTLTKVVKGMVEQIAALAQEVAIEYPAQDMRRMRPFLTNLDVEINPPQGFLGSRSLWAKRNSILFLINQLKSLEVCLPETASADLSAILEAKTLLDIVEHFAPKGNRKVKMVPPDGLPAYETEISYENSAIAVFNKQDRSPKEAPGCESTSKTETALKNNEQLKALLGMFPSSPPIAGQRPFEFYIDAYGIDRNMEVPGLEKLKAQLNKEYKGKVTNPNRIWITNFTPTPAGKDTYALEASYGDRYIDLEQHKPIFQFIKTYESAYKEAAKLLYSSHSDVFSYETVVTLLELNTFAELFWSEGEEPWQDAGASLAYNTKQKDALNTTYEDYKQKGFILGIRIGDKPNERIYQVAPSIWQISSTKSPVEIQGLGPNALIIGPFLEAAAYDNGKLFAKYFPGVKMPESKEGKRALAVQIALDPELSIKAVALVFDVNLRNLKKTVFSNSEIRMPDNVYPTFKDAKKAREYYVISWLRYIKAFPEVAVNFPDYFPYGHYSWDIEFIGGYFKVIQSIMGQEDNWPELKANYIPSKGKPIADYFGDGKDPKNMDALMLILTPKK